MSWYTTTTTNTNFPVLAFDQPTAFATVEHVLGRKEFATARADIYQMLPAVLATFTGRDQVHIGVSPSNPSKMDAKTYGNARVIAVVKVNTSKRNAKKQAELIARGMKRCMVDASWRFAGEGCKVVHDAADQKRSASKKKEMYIYAY